MRDDEHFENMKKMYVKREVNSRFRPRVFIASGMAEVEIPVDPEHFHSGESVHGSVYFKIMDDSAFFAANSLEKTFFILTSTFNTYITHPVSTGSLKSVARVVSQAGSQFIVEAVCYNENKEVARGNGMFIRTKRLLSGVADYAS